MFKEGDVDKWFGKFDKAFSNMDKSIKTATEGVESYLKQRTDDLTPTLSYALINSRETDIKWTKNTLTLKISFNSDGSADYAVEQHEAPYSHDYSHNPPEAQTFKGGTPLRYLKIPLVDEREEWWRKYFSKVGWK